MLKFFSLALHLCVEACLRGEMAARHLRAGTLELLALQRDSLSHRLTARALSLSLGVVFVSARKEHNINAIVLMLSFANTNSPQHQCDCSHDSFFATIQRLPTPTHQNINAIVLILSLCNHLASSTNSPQHQRYLFIRSLCNHLAFANTNSPQHQRYCSRTFSLQTPTYHNINAIVLIRSLSKHNLLSLCTHPPQRQHCRSLSLQAHQEKHYENTRRQDEHEEARRDAE